MKNKCPKCGADRAKSQFRMPGEFECGSFEDEFQGFSESMNCLRNQLTKRDKEIRQLERKLVQDCNWFVKKDRMIERLQANENKLPKTEDGVTVVPGEDDVWCPKEKEMVHIIVSDCCVTSPDCDCSGYGHPLGRMAGHYSSQKAAEAKGEE